MLSLVRPLGADPLDLEVDMLRIDREIGRDAEGRREVNKGVVEDNVARAGLGIDEYTRVLNLPATLIDMMR